jgi:methyl-accepting chemotaxis protein
MNEIWTAVNSETNAAPGSYAMIIDGHGVRIAYTNTDTTLTTLPQALFKAVAPLSSQFQQRIDDEDLYGNSFSPVKVLPDTTLANVLQHPQTSATFQLVPALRTQSFQAYQVTCQIVPWTYLVFRPVNTITQAANQQDIYLVLLAAVVTLLAALVGLLVGRGITRPILRSVSSLLGSSQELKTLSDHEQVTATEQKWIVESSEIGLKSVQYYAKATSVAASKLNEMSTELMQNLEWLDAWQTKQRLNEIIQAGHYIEKASSHQLQSNKSLSTGIRITTQVTEQLVSGAKSAAEAAAQLEEVIRQLRQVVGE